MNFNYVTDTGAWYPPRNHQMDQRLNEWLRVAYSAVYVIL